MIVHVSAHDVRDTLADDGGVVCVTGTDASGQRVTLQLSPGQVLPGDVEADDIIRKWDEVPDTADD
jgi:hypothetical protein